MVHTKDKFSLSCLISVIFVLFIGMLGILSVFLHCDTSIYDFYHTKTIVTHTPLLYVGLVIVEIGIIIFLCMFLEQRFSDRERAKAARIIVLVCGGILFLEGIVWIFFNDGMPINDQINVYWEAQKIAGVSKEPFDTDYFALFHRNRGITLFVALAIKIFGNHLYSFPLFNLAAVLVIYFSICRTTEFAFQNSIVTVITALFLMMFYPLIVYESFIYGTLLSAAGASFGLYAVTALCETGKLRYGIYMIFAFPFGILMHQSAAIGLIAAILYLLIKSKRETLLRNLLIIALTVSMVFAFTKIVDATFTRITGTDSTASAVPAICTIYMGLSSTAEGGGPGSQDGSYAQIFMDNNRDAAAASREAVQSIGKVMKEYLSGERSLTFFLEKVEYQWLDPSFGARKVINLNNPDAWDEPNSDLFIAFYHSSLRSYIFKIAISFMLLIYAGALIAGIKSICNSRKYPVVMLLQLYVIGGGAFQMLWESLSRYCFGYFLWIIPTAAFGVYSLYCFLKGCRVANGEKS